MNYRMNIKYFSSLNYVNTYICMHIIIIFMGGISCMDFRYMNIRNYMYRSNVSRNVYL